MFRPLSELTLEEAMEKLYATNFRNQWSEYMFCRMLSQSHGYDFDDHFAPDDMRGLDDGWAETHERYMEKLSCQKN